MTFLFVSGSFDQWGGVETLTVRMASWLLGAGHQVLLLTRSGGIARQLFPEGVALVSLGGDFDRLKWKGKRFGRKLCRDRLGPYSVDVIVAFTPTALWVAAGLLNGLGYPVALLASVWGPSAYIETGIIGLLKDPSAHCFRTQLAPESRSFMSEEIKSCIEKASGRFIGGFVWPAAVDGKRYVGVQRQPRNGLIVSIGRLEDMKYYNRQVPGITRDLLSRGYDVHWDIYGDGVDRHALAAAISNSGLEDRIQLRGTIEYHRLPEALIKAQVFVGMGTSLVEAGFCGVPSVCAIPWNEEPTTHGCLHEMPGYVTGERVAQPLFRISDVVAKLLDLSPTEYVLTANKTREHVNRFELENLMPEFMNRVSRMPRTSRVWRPGWVYLVGQLAIWMWKGPLWVIRGIDREFGSSGGCRTALACFRPQTLAKPKVVLAENH